MRAHAKRETTRLAVYVGCQQRMDRYRLAQHLRVWLTKETKAALVTHMRLMANEHRVRRSLFHFRRNLARVETSRCDLAQRKRAREEGRTLTRRMERRRLVAFHLWRQQTPRLALERRLRRQVVLHYTLRAQARFLSRWVGWWRSNHSRKVASRAAHGQHREATIAVSFYHWQQWCDWRLLLAARCHSVWVLRQDQALHVLFSQWQCQAAESLDKRERVATALKFWQNLKVHSAWVEWSNKTDIYFATFDKLQWAMDSFHRSSLHRSCQLWRSATARHFHHMESIDTGQSQSLRLRAVHAWRKWHLYLRRATLGKHLLTEAELHHVKGVWREWLARCLSRERRFAAIWEAMGKKRTPTLPSRHLILIRTPT